MRFPDSGLSGSGGCRSKRRQGAAHSGLARGGAILAALIYSCYTRTEFVSYSSTMEQLVVSTFVVLTTVSVRTEHLTRMAESWLKGAHSVLNWSTFFGTDTRQEEAFNATQY